MSRYFYSIPFYWVMLGISSLKIISTFITSIWLFNDTQNMRKWLSRAMCLNWISSGTSTIFGLCAITIFKDSFWPRGMTQGGFLFNLKVALGGLLPTFFFLYFWTLAREFANAKASEEDEVSCC